MNNWKAKRDEEEITSETRLLIRKWKHMKLNYVKITHKEDAIIAIKIF